MHRIRWRLARLPIRCLPSAAPAPALHVRTYVHAPLSGSRHSASALAEASRELVLTGTDDAGGAGLNASYNRLRRDAMEQARQRNRFYQRASEACVHMTRMVDAALALL